MRASLMAVAGLITITLAPAGAGAALSGRSEDRLRPPSGDDVYRAGRI